MLAMMTATVKLRMDQLHMIGRAENAKSLSEIARVIKEDWKEPYFGAVPYINAMLQLNTLDPNEPFIAEDARTQVIYFLGNAQTWRGPIAREVKALLKRLYK